MNTELTPAVSLSALSHRYGKTLALDDVSLDIPKGATVGLIGPDGVGKSTLLSLVAGAREIQTGTVNVFGGDMAGKAVRQEMSHRIAFMPQGLGRNLYPTLSVYENIDFHARLFGMAANERRARIQRLLDATGLAPFPDRAAGKLSGGMKQKVSLCCALVHSPDLLILDEPTTGVDPLSRRQFWALVDELRAEHAGMTVIVATAYIEEAERFEHLLAMDAGRLLVSRPTREVMAQYGTKTLEEAYIAMLPSEKQTGAGGLEITPFVPDPDEPPAMEAHGLTKRFGDFTAVDHVSFTIGKGEIFGFLGSNGCGKSTTMKMLTGLIRATEGDAKLLGEPIAADNMQTRLRVGYMSQAFSLYEELTARQNLDLHAKLYQMGSRGKAAVNDALAQFQLADVADTAPAALPLGIRQRLQLAAACLHKPEVLILDEPTSGVDPAARDMFWRHLLKLSREDKITIFVSTHFMNEAERCDRISFMHKGRVLAVGTPPQLTAAQNAPDLEEAFVAYLVEAEGAEKDGQTAPTGNQAEPRRPSENECLSEKSIPVENENAGLKPGLHGSEQTAQPSRPGFSPASVQAMPSEKCLSENADTDPSNPPPQPTPRLSDGPDPDPTSTPPRRPSLSTVWAFARRETKELLHDKIRLFFAICGPLIMMSAIAWGISFDVQNLRFSVFDRDQTVASRQLAEYFSGSRYFLQQPEIHDESRIDTVLKSSQAVLVMDIPAGFGRALMRGETPEVSFYIDGALPFNASNIQGYIGGIMTMYAQDGIRETGLPVSLQAPAQVVPRFRYNQDFNSINAIAPGVMMLVLVMIPAMMSAIGVVREKETGSITNLYISPAGVPQYLIGKQLPYIAVGMLNFLSLALVMNLWFGVHLKGSFFGLAFGTLLMVTASTAMGLLISSFVRSQLAAIFVAAIGTLLPTINYSGFLYPLSTMSGSAYVFGKIFPASWYLNVSIGSFTKGLNAADLRQEYAVIAVFALACITASCLLLKKQER
ncbi:ribosome-associated ATPase/putative transporter RbbA [Neisseria chenwenguii]|uniref:ribosome-associated ATPase/putative transporter RbbA n=1 Tax=Neisseria chenwenguii TaxID=1853278 RepID=UPI000F4FFA56|nr:ribosome-associated ATPase/putative transporter RbbA [Neisseria chenwenguii]ROV55355.1 ABC transporter ATP-binding protein/permease [Neisseria chenwenguii]